MIGRLSDDAADLASPGGFHELERSLKQFEILLVLGRIGAVDLYPFPSAGHPAGLKRDDVALENCSSVAVTAGRRSPTPRPLMQANILSLTK